MSKKTNNFRGEKKDWKWCDLEFSFCEPAAAEESDGERRDGVIRVGRQRGLLIEMKRDNIIQQRQSRGCSNA